MHGEGDGSPLHYSCLENPRDGKPGGLQSMGSLESDTTEATQQQQQQQHSHLSQNANLCILFCIKMYHPCYPFIHLTVSPLYCFWVYIVSKAWTDRELTEPQRNVGLFLSWEVAETNTMSPTSIDPWAASVSTVCTRALTAQCRNQFAPDPSQTSLLAAHQHHLPLHSSKSQHLLSIFFILISQGMKMTTKLQARRANFRHS